MVSFKKILAETEKLLPKSVKNITGDVLSAPAQVSSALQQRKSKIDFLRLKNARRFKGMPDLNEDGSVTEGFKARSVANETRERLSKPKKLGFKETYKKAIAQSTTRAHRH